MQNLFLAVVLIAYLFLIFKFFKRVNINSFHAIVINYIVCVITGLFFIGNIPIGKHFEHDWLKWGIICGSLFLPTFYLMAYTVEKVNVSVATVANKMSLIIPVVFSYFFLRKGPEKFTLINLIGIAIAFLSILLTSYQKSDKKTDEKKNYRLLLLPIGLFLLGGVLDALINYTSYTYLAGKDQALFSVTMFATAAIIGSMSLTLKMIYTRQFIPIRDIIGGILLGIPNYFSLYFLLKALSDFNNDGAMVYPVVNICVIVFSALSAVVLFKEKLLILNLIGISLSIFSLILIFW